MYLDPQHWFKLRHWDCVEYLVVGVEGEDAHQDEVGPHTCYQHRPRLGTEMQNQQPVFYTNPTGRRSTGGGLKVNDDKNRPNGYNGK